MKIVAHIPGIGLVTNLAGFLFGTLLDRAVNKFSGRGSLAHFHAGLGDIKNTKRLEEAVKVAMLDSSPNASLSQIENIIWEDNWRIINNAQERHGYFITPLLSLSSDTNPVADNLLNTPGRKAHFKIITPSSKLGLNSFDVLPDNTRIAVILPAFGDQGFATREQVLAKGLAMQGITSILLEQYSYGKRCSVAKANESPIVVDTVCDMILKSIATLAEGTALLRHLHQLGFKDLCISGISMGGGLATMIAGALPFKVATAAIVPCHRFAPAFIENVMASACDYGAVTKKDVAELLAYFDCREYPLPQNLEAVVILAASHDGYIPASFIAEISEYWGANIDLRWIFGGHASTILLHGTQMQRAIVDAFRAND